MESEARKLSPVEVKHFRTERAEVMARQTVEEWGEIRHVAEIRFPSMRRLIVAIQQGRIVSDMPVEFRMNLIAGDTEAGLRELFSSADTLDVGLGFLTESGLWGIFLYRQLLVPQADGGALVFDVPDGIREVYANAVREPLRLAFNAASGVSLENFPKDTN
jgi:hypothetical protein